MQTHTCSWPEGLTFLWSIWLLFRMNCLIPMKMRITYSGFNTRGAMTKSVIRDKDCIRFMLYSWERNFHFWWKQQFLASIISLKMSFVHVKVHRICGEGSKTKLLFSSHHNMSLNRVFFCCHRSIIKLSFIYFCVWCIFRSPKSIFKMFLFILSTREILYLEPLHESEYPFWFWLTTASAGGVTILASSRFVRPILKKTATTNLIKGKTMCFGFRCFTLASFLEQLELSHVIVPKIWIDWRLDTSVQNTCWIEMVSHNHLIYTLVQFSALAFRCQWIVRISAENRPNWIVCWKMLPKTEQPIVCSAPILSASYYHFPYFPLTNRALSGKSKIIKNIENWWRCVLSKLMKMHHELG